MTYTDIVLRLAHQGVGSQAVKTALESRGYHQLLSLAKHPLNEQNKGKRLNWITVRLQRAYKNCRGVISSDKTWVADWQTPRCMSRGKLVSSYSSDCLTLGINFMQSSDELEEFCLVDKTQKEMAWMFWGSFTEQQRGPCLFWGKDWKLVTARKYFEHVVPLVIDCIKANPSLQFMHDNDPLHKAAYSREDLRVNNINPTIWLAFTSDLNPIQAVWSETKDFIEVRYPDQEDGRE